MSEPKPEAIYTRFDPQENAAIRALAEERKWTLSTAVRELVKRGLEVERAEAQR